MDENELTEVTYELIPRLHNRWSVLVLATNWLAGVAEVTASAIQSANIMMAQHAVQKNTDHEFAEMIGEIDG